MTNLPNGDNTWVLLLQIGAVGFILWLLFFRKKFNHPDEKHGLQRIEIKLSGVMTPAEVRLTFGHPAQIVIHRYDKEPPEELFEIEELGIYELLPAHYSTIIAVNPQKRGRFPMILGGERKAGMMLVE